MLPKLMKPCEPLGSSIYNILPSWGAGSKRKPGIALISEELITALRKVNNNHISHYYAVVSHKIA